MGATDSAKRWVSEIQQCDCEVCGSMDGFLDHLRCEQESSEPFPGEVCYLDVPETAKIWNEISKRLMKKPDHPREAEIAEMWKKVMQEYRDQHYGDLPEDWDLTPITAPRFTTTKTAEPSLFHFRFFMNQTERLSYDLRFILTLPTLEDKVMSFTCMAKHYNGKFWDTPPFVAHVTAFDDLQARTDDPNFTGFAIAHDLLSDDILIGNFSEKKEVDGYGRRIERLHLGFISTWVQQAPGLFPLSLVESPVVFRGSPAKLARLILDRGSFDGVSDEFGELIKYIAGEWILLNASAIKRVQSPAEHRGTFTDNLHLQLQTYLENVLLGDLKSRSLPSGGLEGVVGFTEDE